MKKRTNNIKVRIAGEGPKEEAEPMLLEVEVIQEPLLAKADYLSIRSLLGAIGGNLGVSVESIKSCVGYKLVDLRASRLCAISSPIAQAAETGFTHKVADELLPAAETRTRLYRSSRGEENDDYQVDQDAQHENDEITGGSLLASRERSSIETGSIRSPTTSPARSRTKCCMFGGKCRDQGLHFGAL